MRRRRQEVLFIALNCPSRDLGESGVKVRYADLMRTQLFPSHSNQPKPGASERIFICANQEILI